MPFQDIDEVSTTPYPDSPSPAEAWFRKIFIDDWFLKFLALAISLLLWMAVTGINKPVTIRTGVQLNFIRPDKLEISNDPPRTVDVLLTGRRSKLESIGPADLVATVDLSEQHEGERVVRLSAGLVQIDLPEGIKIESFQPSTIPIRLEPIIESQAAVEARLEGKPADGYEVYGVKPSPDKVTIRGPAGHVDALKTAPTESISVEGRKESFSTARVAIDVPDHKVDLVEPTVDVMVEIGEQRTERTFAGVAVVAEQGSIPQPRTVSVTLFGPASVLTQMKSDSLKVTLTPSANGGEPHVILPPGLQDRVIVKSITPSTIAIPR